jgi:hypothetical protein
MASLSYDYYNHQAIAPGTTYATGATGTTVAGTVVPVAAGAGTGSSTAIITGSSPNDTRGQFNLVAAGSPAAGSVAVVNFSFPYGALQGSVVASCIDTTASPEAPIAIAPVITQTGITFYAGALTAAHTYTISYHVVA